MASNGRVYQERGRFASEYVDTGISGIQSIAYSPSLSGITGVDGVGALWFWDDSASPGNGSWRRLAPANPSVWLGPRGPIVSGIFEVLQNQNRVSVDFSVGSTAYSQFAGPNDVNPDASWELVADLHDHNPTPIFVLEGAVMADAIGACGGLGSGGYGGPLSPAHANGVRDLAWAQNGNSSMLVLETD